jgi:hypothetical protein
MSKGNFWTVAPKTEWVEFELDGRKGKLELKLELTVGEQRDVDTAGFKSVGNLGARKDDERSNPEIGVDWKAQSFARTLAYLVDWDLADDYNNKIKVSKATVESLRQPVYAALESAINAHVERQESLRKNDRAGEPQSPAISA